MKRRGSNPIGRVTLEDPSEKDGEHPERVGGHESHSSFPGGREWEETIPEHNRNLFETAQTDFDAFLFGLSGIQSQRLEVLKEKMEIAQSCQNVRKGLVRLEKLLGESVKKL